MKSFKKTLLMMLTILILSANIVLADETTNETLNLSVSSAISYDMETDEIIYTLNIDKKIYAASITKVMTALLLAENMEKTDMLVYTESAAKQPAYSYRENVQYIAIGDKIRADYVMDMLLLYSANDIAYVIADNVAGNTENFMKMMNDKAIELGMKNTHYETANGLDKDYPEHVTTAYDLMRLFKAAYENPWVRESMNKEKSIVKSLNTPSRTLTNRNKNLNKAGCIGGKTGYTDRAGRCLGAIYERNGRKIISIVLNSKNLFEDVEKLADYSYSAKKVLYIPKGGILKTIEQPYKPVPLLDVSLMAEIPIYLKEDLKYYKNDIAPELTYNDSDVDVWRLNNNTPFTSVTLTLRDYSCEYDAFTDITIKEILKADFKEIINQILPKSNDEKNSIDNWIDNPNNNISSSFFFIN
ncbi:D-alanyl-D-alanine carboxypeptidase family protein [Oceanirhabdus sp. W0125-5]|uniref:D-alanyl-D-alanine carboxypeptidase family protein n=1 Tax=Oceanirhabdus sp. W0125-5 TaxID=2999116 RepID=UPI0022F2ACC8|nr:serine hydrolase [Oceanirhabdus sp. W0125-5]WBW96037.1 serine hydrolase [Oceanirhabdus sp. W0125-5]